MSDECRQESEAYLGAACLPSPPLLTEVRAALQ